MAIRQVTISKELRGKINQARKDFPGCKACGFVKFSEGMRVHIRDQDGNLLREIREK